MVAVSRCCSSLTRVHGGSGGTRRDLAPSAFTAPRITLSNSVIYKGENAPKEPEGLKPATAKFHSFRRHSRRRWTSDV